VALRTPNPLAATVSCSIGSWNKTKHPGLRILRGNPTLSRVAPYVRPEPWVAQGADSAAEKPRPH
jgi:hypothetical protein